MLDVDNLIPARGDRKLCTPLSFALTKGQALMVAGANGSGKSTLLRLLAGLLPCFFGDYTIAAPFHYLGHRNALDGKLSIKEHVEFLADLHNVPLTPSAFAFWDLAELKNKPVSTLSEGQKRRAALAQLSIIEKPLWLLDEPHTALDTTHNAKLVAFMDAHLKKGGAILYAAHDGLILNGAKTITLHANEVAP